MFAMTPKSRVVFVHALNELKKDIAPVVKGLLVNYSLAIKAEGAYAYLMCTVVLDEELPWIAAAPEQPVLQAPIDLHGASQMGSGGTGMVNGDGPSIDDATPANQNLLPASNSTHMTSPPRVTSSNVPSAANDNNLPTSITNTTPGVANLPTKPAAPRHKITKPRPKPAEQGSGALKRGLVQSRESSEENEHVAKRARPAPRSTGVVEASSSPMQVDLPSRETQSKVAMPTQRSPSPTTMTGTVVEQAGHPGLEQDTGAEIDETPVHDQTLTANGVNGGEIESGQ
jgi:hypothetical protein